MAVLPLYESIVVLQAGRHSSRARVRFRCRGCRPSSAAFQSATTSQGLTSIATVLMNMRHHCQKSGKRGSMCRPVLAGRVRAPITAAFCRRRRQQAGRLCRRLPACDALQYDV